jgi:hypothetical protein
LTECFLTIWQVIRISKTYDLLLKCLYWWAEDRQLYNMASL